VAVAAVSARDEILRRVRTALGDVPARERLDEVVVPRAYRRSTAGDDVERFVERVRDYGSSVIRVDAAEVAAAIATRCRRRGAVRLAVPDDLPASWAPEGIELLAEAGLDAAGLDAIDGAVTGCRLAIALTGTIVLDGGPAQGTRRLTLVPDYHACVVDERQIVGGVPEAFAALAPQLRRGPGWITFVSGPSATSDIELSRVEGVHGPRTLDVFVVRQP
jgi:L-lactate dehydrogenase complex protein LldG